MKFHIKRVYKLNNSEETSVVTLGGEDSKHVGGGGGNRTGPAKGSFSSREPQVEAV